MKTCPLSCGKGYRLLNVGEPIKGTDEVCIFRGKRLGWVWMEIGVGCRGARVNENNASLKPFPYGYYRRKVEVIPIHTCSYVTATDLFRGIENLFYAWSNMGLPFTYGDANRTLISGVCIFRFITGNGLQDEFPNEIKELGKRIKGIGFDTYVDFEN